jgi:hypothetical protein
LLTGINKQQLILIYFLALFAVAEYPICLHLFIGRGPQDPFSLRSLKRRSIATGEFLFSIAVPRDSNHVGLQIALPRPAAARLNVNRSAETIRSGSGGKSMREQFAQSHSI